VVLFIDMLGKIVGMTKVYPANVADVTIVQKSEEHEHLRSWFGDNDVIICLFLVLIFR